MHANPNSAARGTLALLRPLPAAQDAPPTDASTRAERTMQLGKRMVIAGYVVSMFGVVAYCIVCLGAGLDQDVGSALIDHAAVLIAPTLGVLGIGTLLWLAGSFLYLSGAMDADGAETSDG